MNRSCSTYAGRVLTPELNDMFAKRPRKSEPRIGRESKRNLVGIPKNEICGLTRRVVHVYGNDPTPPWPEEDIGKRCACGAELEYLTVVYQH